jgi:hypothetical protein
MSQMVSARSWRLGGSAAFVVVALLAGCGRVIGGVAEPPAAGGAAEPVPVADLLVEPDRFPTPYRAAVLDGTAIYHVLQDIEGVARGAVVTPAECAPAPRVAHDSAAAQGVDSDTAISLIVVVTRPAAPLSTRVDQLRGCPTFTAANGGDVSQVTTSLLPAPPVDADDSAAIDQTVRSPAGMRRTITFVAQIADTRVSATWLHEGAAADDPDTAALDALFSDAVLKVRRAT